MLYLYIEIKVQEVTMAFVRTVKTKTAKGEVHKYVRVVESYWEKGKKKQRVIANLGNVIALHKNIKQIINGLLRAVGEKLLGPVAQVKTGVAGCSSSGV